MAFAFDSVRSKFFTNSNRARLNPKAFVTHGHVAATLERAVVQHVKRQKAFGNILDLGFRVPIEPIEAGFTVIVNI